MSTSPSKNSREGAPEGSQPPPRKVGILFSSSPFFRSWFNKSDSSDPRGSGGSKEKPRESQSSTDNENPGGSKTDEVPSKEFRVKPKDLKICWKEESQYWSIPEGDDGPAELLEVCWLDVSGEMPVTKGKAYEVSFMLSMNTENSFGWDDPVTVMARIGKEREYTRQEIKLSDLSGEVEERPQDKCRVEFKRDEKSERKEEPPEKKNQTKKKGDENANNNEEKLYFGLYEVWTNKWKGGLRIHEAIVQEIPAGNNASPSITRSNELRGKEIEAHDDSISTSENPQSSRSSRST